MGHSSIKFLMIYANNSMHISTTKVPKLISHSTKKWIKKHTVSRSSSFGSLSSLFKTGLCRKLLITFSVRLPYGAFNGGLFDAKVSYAETICEFASWDKPWDALSGTFFANPMILPVWFWLVGSFNMVMPLCNDAGRLPWKVDKLGAIPNFIIIFVMVCW